jgi:carboxyl-terminal processing protease
MLRPGRGGHQFRGYSPLVVAAIILSLYVVLSPSEFRFQAKRRLVQNPQLNLTDELTAPDATVLLDSIVNLVQTYYVDSERVSGEKLMIGTMRSLAYAIPDLKFHDAVESYALESNVETIRFIKNDEMAYDELVRQLKSLAAFCERIQVTQLIGSSENLMLGSERDTSAIVLNALLSSLDAHSSLLSTDAYQELRQGTEGSFGGLGVLVGIRDHVLTVLKPLPRSPAIRMGIRQDDKIIAIDGQSTFGVGLDRLVTHMRGAPGTGAELLTLRPGDWAPKKIKLQRELIAVDSVEATEHHKNNLHILQLSVENFASRTTKEIREHIRQFRKKYTIHGLVLDLRGNPGGLLDQAVHVSDIFLDKGVVVTTRGRRDEIETASQSNDETDYPIVVLMNEDSASASEIVAGALQDNGRAIVVGQPSFGKGSVQTVFELPDQRALKLTIARYYTPANKSIQNIGITPDIWIQPLIKSVQNANLFGPYRYRNEQFLPNHLNASLPESSKSMSPFLKGYYLVPQGKGSNISRIQSDPSMDVALGIFSKLAVTYGSRIPLGARRAAHWMALTKNKVDDVLAPLSKEAMAWLESKHNIKWQSNVQRLLVTPNLKLDILAPVGGMAAAAGGSLDVPWRIYNLGNDAVDNISVFIQSPVSGLETKEFLIGRIGANETREGKLKIQIPAGTTPGRRYVSAGIALDAQAISSTQDEFIVSIGDRDPESIFADVSFRDGAGSRHQNILEAEERGYVAVMLQNKSNSALRNLKITCSNLGGNQVVLPTPEVSITSLMPGEQRIVDVPVEAKSRLESTSVVIGVAVQHAASSETIFAVSDVKTTISFSQAEKLSH